MLYVHLPLMEQKTMLSSFFYWGEPERIMVLLKRTEKESLPLL